MTREQWEDLIVQVDKLSNVSRACERMGVSRSLYYKWLKIYGTTSGKDSAQGHTRRRHPHAIPVAIEEEILAIAQANPDWGCQRISVYLDLKKMKASAVTVHKVLDRNGGFTIRKRLKSKIRK